MYPAGTPIPMTPLRAQGPRRAARSDLPGARQQLLDPPGVHQRQRQGRAARWTCQSEPGALAVRALRLAQARRPSTSRRFRCRRAAPATATSTRATSSWRSARPGRRPARRCSRCGSAGRSTQGGKNPPALGTRQRADAFGLRRPARPTRASRAACPTQLITGYSDLGRQATNPQWQYPTVWNPKINYTWLMGTPLVQGRLRVPAHQRPKCRTSTRSTAATPTAASSRGRPAPRRTTSTTSPTSCSACARSTRSATSWSPNMRQQMHFTYLQDDCAGRTIELTLNLGPALRVRDAALGGGQHPDELRSRRRRR